MTVNAAAANRDYTLKLQDKTLVIPGENRATAAEIDVDHDFFLSTTELENYVSKDSQSKPAPQDLTDQANDFQCALAKVKNPYAEGYHSFDALIQDFDKLARDNPDYVKKVILGKSPEGRDLVAYKLTQGAQGDTSSKPGVVITGCHHAREWMTAEAPLALARALLEPCQEQRLKDGEVWIVPCANPDGYEYSRETDNLWRKNRRVLGTDQNGNATAAIGVDLNRNFGENTLNHRIIFRPDGDTPGNTADDFGATSDDPFSEVYRGPSAASEPEVKAMQDLQLRPNIRAVMDYHSYTDDLLYPWSHTHEKPLYEAFYLNVGGKIQSATGYRLEPGVGMYPVSGSSDIFQQANGLKTFTVEMGQSFQPHPQRIPELAAVAVKAATIFIDEVQGAALNGSLGPRVAIEMPPAQPNRLAGPAPSVRTDSGPAIRFFAPH